MLEKSPESPLGFKEIKSVHPKGNQSWIFIGRTDAEAEAPILWPSDAKHWLTRKDGEEDNREWDGWMAAQTQWTQLWAGSGSWWRKGILVCCSPWGHKELTWLSNWITTTGSASLTCYLVLFIQGNDFYSEDFLIFSLEFFFYKFYIVLILTERKYLDNTQNSYPYLKWPFKCLLAKNNEQSH